MTTTFRAFRAPFILEDNNVREVDRNVLVKIRTAHLSGLGNDSAWAPPYGRQGVKARRY